MLFIEMRGATNWATYVTSFYILMTGTGSQSILMKASDVKLKRR